MPMELPKDFKGVAIYFEGDKNLRVAANGLSLSEVLTISQEMDKMKNFMLVKVIEDLRAVEAVNASVVVGGDAKQ